MRDVPVRCPRNGSLTNAVEASGVRLVANGSTSAFANGSDANGSTPPPEANGSTPPHASLLAAAAAVAVAGAGAGAGAGVRLEFDADADAVVLMVLLIGEPHGSFAGSLAATNALHASTATGAAPAAAGLLVPVDAGSVMRLAEVLPAAAAPSCE